MLRASPELTDLFPLLLQSWLELLCTPFQIQAAFITVTAGKAVQKYQVAGHISSTVRKRDSSSVVLQPASRSQSPSTAALELQLRTSQSSFLESLAYEESAG